MEIKVKELFSRIFVKTYDYPFIVGFLEANGINGIVPSLKPRSSRECIDYAIFKKWWEMNCKTYDANGTTVTIDDDDFDFDSEVNPEKGVIKYTIKQGDKKVILNLSPSANIFLNTIMEKTQFYLCKAKKKNKFPYKIGFSVIFD